MCVCVCVRFAVTYFRIPMTSVLGSKTVLPRYLLPATARCIRGKILEFLISPAEWILDERTMFYALLLPTFQTSILLLFIIAIVGFRRARNINPIPSPAYPFGCFFFAINVFVCQYYLKKKKKMKRTTVETSVLATNFGRRREPIVRCYNTPKSVSNKPSVSLGTTVRTRKCWQLLCSVNHCFFVCNAKRYECTQKKKNGNNVWLTTRDICTIIFICLFITRFFQRTNDKIIVGNY